jgi:hypothetical protein
MSYDWYEKVSSDTRLIQGDLINDCPIITWSDSEIKFNGSLERELLTTMTVAIKADVVVMTQSCDLEQDKVNNILLCPHISLTEYKKFWEEKMREGKQNPTDKAWKAHCNDICDGYIWNITMLNSCNNDDIKSEHIIVDFHEVYTIPKVFLESLLKERAQSRLRLLPPYREHLSQAFARFFMRVGLPVPVIKVW